MFSSSESHILWFVRFFLDLIGSKLSQILWMFVHLIFVVSLFEYNSKKSKTVGCLNYTIFISSPWGVFATDIFRLVDHFKIILQLAKRLWFIGTHSLEIWISLIFGYFGNIKIPIDDMLSQRTKMKSRTVKFGMTSFTKLAFKHFIFGRKTSRSVSEKAKVFIVQLTSL